MSALYAVAHARSKALYEKFLGCIRVRSVENLKPNERGFLLLGRGDLLVLIFLDNVSVVDIYIYHNTCTLCNILLWIKKLSVEPH
jgi:hypothetical protein